MNTMKSNQGRKRMTIILTICFVAVLAIGGTLAWLTTTTEQKDNAFNVVTGDGDDMKATLTEKNWKPDDAKALRPGQSIPKDPVITNESDLEIPEWVGMKLTFTEGDGTTELSVAQMVVLNSVIEYTPNAKWTRKNTGDPQSQEIFYYDEVLNRTDYTNALFDAVTVKTTASNENLAKIKGWGGFKIVIKGAAVQGDIPAAQVKAELDGLL